MPRPTAPPGPPPPHYRPPGLPPTAPTLSPLQPQPPAPSPSGASPAAVVMVAITTLLVGIMVGFFLGRATESSTSSSGALLAPPLTSASSSTSRPPGDTIPQNPPSDPDAPPSTDLAPATVGTFDDPIPAGQAYVLGLYEIEVRSVDRDAGPELQSYDELNPRAPEGRQHVLVEVAIRFTDRDGLGNPDRIPFFLTDGTGEWNDYEATCGLVPGDLADVGLLEQGDEAVGVTCFTVPSDVVDSVVLGTEGFAGPIYFALPE